MPSSPDGKIYDMNPARFNQKMQEAGQSVAADPAAPAADETTSVTITKTPDGGFTVECMGSQDPAAGGGQGPQQFANVEDMLAYVSDELSPGDNQEDQAEGGEGDDFGGEPRSPSGLTA